MKARRGRGEGSVFYNKSKRLYCAIVTLGHDERGKRKRKYLYAKTKEEVLRKRSALEHDHIAGRPVVPTKLTVAAFAQQWLDARSGLRDGTLYLYKGFLRNYVLPALGMIRLIDLSPLHLIQLLANMERDGKSARLREQVYRLLHAMLNWGVKCELLVRNVCNNIDAPRPTRRPMRSLTSEQAFDLLRAARSERLHALFVLAVMSGLRLGELLGLKWSDVDFEAARISVQRSLLEQGGRLQEGEPKTAAGKRSIKVPPLALHALREHKKRMLLEGNPGPSVFCNTRGGPYRRSNFYGQFFKPLLKKAGLPDHRFHDLRHTAASLMLSQGIQAKVVQETLGHSRIGLTLDTYSHVLPSMQDEAATRMESLFAEADL